MAPLINLQIFTFNIFQEKTYLIYNQYKESILIDPGCSTTAEEEQLTAYIESHGLVIKHLLNTHAHIDHIIGNAFIKQKYGVPLAMHAEGLPLLAVASQEKYGFTAYQPIAPDLFLVQGDTISITDCALDVLYVPGHAPGHLAFYSQALNICFVGDTLFKGNIGRTDLWGGNSSLLVERIRSQLLTLPDELIIYPGHGEPTTIGAEKSQPFFV
ncbi:MAG: MBL fold metallo-hydrolase [Amoebophilaceae bacterium]|nr:MBL fold metallo-hydrolase [Amoebophilaceae bacterium]